MQFIDSSVNTEALGRFFDKMKENDCDIHTFQIYHKGKRLVRMSLPPYSCDDVRENFSLSKTFAATVVGRAAYMGLLSVSDKVLDFFPEIETDNEYFKMMTLEHVLSMDTGHDDCVMPQMAFGEDSVKGFFSVEPKYEPGTHFTYNTGATCLLSLIVERVTGEKFFDFASKELLFPMGITNAYWNTCQSGACQGGVGLHIASDDIIKLGLLYINDGVYEGRRYLTHEWVERAMSVVSDNSHNDDEPDGSSGYGYQIWRNGREGYRAIGIFGQFCIMLPEREAVIAIQSCVGSEAITLDSVIDLMDEIYGEHGEHPAPCYLPEAKTDAVEPIAQTYILDDNLQGFKYLHVLLSEDKLELSFSSELGMVTLRGGNGEWLYSEYFAKYMTPNLSYLMPSDAVEKVAASGCFYFEGEDIVLHLRYRTTVFREQFKISMKEDSVTVSIGGAIRSSRASKFTGKII